MEDIERIQFIRRAQQLGFSLPEIRELLLLQREDGAACSRVCDLLKEKIEVIHNKIAELATLEQQLKQKLRKCEGSLRISADAHKGCCPVLEEIAYGGSDEH
jgi:DNA-binding transcriptional MerR regulator